MKYLKIYCLFLILLFSGGMISAEAKLRVVASIPDLADMARIIGGNNVKVVCLTTGREDLHAVPVRPSFIPKLNRADLLLNLGLDAEHAWLPGIVNESRNPKVMESGSGWIEVNKGIEILDRPKKFDRAEGHQHPLGNPHYNVGPQCGKHMAKNIAAAFIQNDPDNSQSYQTNLASYLKRIETLERELMEAGKPLNGIVVISYHEDVSYLCHFYGLKKVGAIEPKPGIEPSTRYLSDLVNIIKQKHVQLIIYNQAQNPKLPESLARRTGISAVQFANTAGAKPEIQTWIDLQRYNLKVLLKGINGR
jgi:zinc/manganese transport system substrate-binding protein